MLPLAPPEGLSAIGAIPISTMRTAPMPKFGTSTKTGEKASGTPGPGSYPLLKSMGPEGLVYRTLTPSPSILC